MIGIIVQARTGSTRFPNKILKEIIDGSTIIEYLLSNLRKVNHCENIIIATTNNPKDDFLVKTLSDYNIEYYRGSEIDVRQRYIEAAEAFGFDVIIRIPSDNPFTIPSLIDKLITIWKMNSIDYLSTTLSGTFPIGTHIEIFTLNALKKSKSLCSDNLSIEHVTPCIYNNSSIFKILSYKNNKNLSKYRLTIDYTDDLYFAKNLAERIGGQCLNLDEIISLIDSEPSIFHLNSMHKKDSIISF